ncbi:hypothetical protein HPG69_006688 [Diceros bicornis minor]|uniref:Uncharacterized protein n=1 Tax=Diceros bicornis minor TaxID=77932 RepID=A0A7J7F6E1_DICBM|nr:hypothetical protein HPG69_006688 [Diceros bicornis minor]
MKRRGGRRLERLGRRGHAGSAAEGGAGSQAALPQALREAALDLGLALRFRAPPGHSGTPGIAQPPGPSPPGSCWDHQAGRQAGSVGRLGPDPGHQDPWADSPSGSACAERGGGKRSVRSHPASGG